MFCITRNVVRLHLSPLLLQCQTCKIVQYLQLVFVNQIILEFYVINKGNKKEYTGKQLVSLKKWDVCEILTDGDEWNQSLWLSVSPITWEEVRNNIAFNWYLESLIKLFFLFLHILCQNKLQPCSYNFISYHSLGINTNK